METKDIHFTDSPSVQGREDRYAVVRVNTAKILKSWQKSLFSFEWLTPDGKIRSVDELPMRERDRRLDTEIALKKGQPLERPVLGIGLLDNVEIGSGRAIFLTLAAQGQKEIEVHIPVSNRKDFAPFLSA